jgi:hypothetical protein
MPSAINPFDDDKLADWQQWGRKASYEKHLRDGGQ